MPPLLAALPIIAAIGSLAGTGVGLGLELSNRPGSPKPPSTTTTPAVQTPAEQSQQQAQQKALISQQTPNVLSATSGLANPAYVEQIASLLSGTAGQPGSTGAAQQAVGSAFGFNSLPGTPKSFTPSGGAGGSGGGTSGAPNNLSDFVNSFLT